ncbi:MAG: AmmeMemoRadiSam system protein B [Polyangiales bacterium]
MNKTTRPPAVAGLFYPASPRELSATVDALLAAARPASPGPAPKAIIAPHAGYVYSGPIAASAYAAVAPRAASVRRVVVIAPAHRARLRGLAGAGADRLRTPLGDVPVDADAQHAAHLPDDVAAHAREHAVEVHLPFVQRLFPGASVVPLVVGDAAPEAVGRALEALWGGDETLVVVSSDLSHYLPYAAGRARDEETARAIESLAPVEPEQACGAAAINGLLWLARRRKMRVERLDLRSSGDTAGPRDEVVGYGAFALHEGAPS